MRVLRTTPVLAAWHFGTVLGDFLTPTYPTPNDLSSNKSLVAASWKNLTSTFDQYLQGGNSSATKALAGVENVTFSIGMFSLDDPKATKLQYHHTSSEIKNAKQGTNNVDCNSIYRVASISKLITVLAGMAELTPDDWNTPLTSINKDFKRQSKNASHPELINQIQWDRLTPWALAAQLSGIPTIGILGDQYKAENYTEYGGPPENISSITTCMTKVALQQDCTAADAIGDIKNMPPNFLPWKTPVYSDLNFMLLGTIISNITGKSLSSVYNSTVFGPLDMTSTTDKPPTDNKTLGRSVIAGEPIDGFAIDFPFTTPSGGIFSTTSDLQRLGIGILNSTLLTTEATDKWMKPVSHTPSLSYSIGAPWEIHRFVHPKLGKVTDLYTKMGDSGYYGGALVVIPEYNAGFTMLNGASDPNRSPLALVILDYVTSTLLPALEAEARAEAKKNLVGSYKSTNSDIEASIKIALNESTPESAKSDLVVSEWMYNGTDILAGPFFGGFQPRLEQSIVKPASSGKPKQLAFQLSLYDQTASYMDAVKLDMGVIGTWTGFYESNKDFSFTDHLRWGGQPIHELVFDVDEDGRAIKCRPVYQQIDLERADKK